MAQELLVGAPLAHDAVGAVITGCAVVATDGAGALAGGAGLVDPIGAEERRAALTAIVARGVADEPVGLPLALAVVPGAPVLVEKPAVVALEAVLAVHASAVFAAVAGGDGEVPFLGALAAVVDVTVLDGDGLADERREAPAAPPRDCRRGHGGRTAWDALTVELVEGVAATAADVAVGGPAAVVAVLVDAPTDLGVGRLRRTRRTTWWARRGERPGG